MISCAKRTGLIRGPRAFCRDGGSQVRGAAANDQYIKFSHFSIAVVEIPRFTEMAEVSAFRSMNGFLGYHFRFLDPITDGYPSVNGAIKTRESQIPHTPLGFDSRKDVKTPSFRKIFFFAALARKLFSLCPRSRCPIVKPSPGFPVQSSARGPGSC